jgi:hypothetical protein
MMETQTVVVDRQHAQELYEQYRQHRHYATEIDREIQRTYRLIAQGRVVIRARESIRAAGLDADKLPKLAIVRADAKECFLQGESSGSATFCHPQGRWPHAAADKRIAVEGLPGIAHRWQPWTAIVPLIPLAMRPRTGLDNYHILWEAEWSKIVPRDPMLLRRLGKGDLWLVCAAWDLTEVEQAALQARVSAT